MNTTTLPYWMNASFNGATRRTAWRASSAFLRGFFSPVLQRSHAANRVERDAPHSVNSEIFAASTEPRGEPRGELLQFFFSYWQPPRFNGATRRTAWRVPEKLSIECDKLKLQRSHAANRVESHQEILEETSGEGLQRSHAANRVERRQIDAEAAQARMASTEPRGEPRGEEKKKVEFSLDKDASTEPRGEPRGEVAVFSQMAKDPNGFNGATRRTAWRVSDNLERGCPKSCFNGATRRTAWRARVLFLSETQYFAEVNARGGPGNGGASRMGMNDQI